MATEVRRRFTRYALTVSITFLDEAQVRRLLPLSDLIPAMAQGLAAFSSGRVVQPVRSVVPIAEHKGFMGVMPAYTGSLGAKVVTFYPNNQGIPTHHALILLFRPETGEPLAVMDGRLITELRTAAVSAVATRELARRDATTLALLGSGVQAESHLAAIRLVRDITQVRVWSPRRARDFAAAHGVEAAPTAEAAVRGADIIVVATSSQTPVLSGKWVAPGAHINAVGATRPEWRELDDMVLEGARLYVDSRDAALKESGDVIAAREIVAEVGEVVAGTGAGRRNEQEITLFKSVGLAVEDVVSADLVFRAAQHAGVA